TMAARRTEKRKAPHGRPGRGPVTLRARRPYHRRHIHSKEIAMNKGMRRAMAPLLLFAALGLGQMAAAAELAANDYIEIQQLYARYNTAIDRNDADAWADTFTADGVFAGNFKGREALK